METFPGEKTYPVDAGVQEERILRSTFLTDPFIVVVAEPRKQWWESFTAENRRVKGRNYFIAKRLVDLVMVMLSLPLLAPVMAVIAALVMLDGGPALFRQQRTGMGGRRFAMYKFRTMVPNAEALKKELAHLNVLQWPDFKIPDDPRITRIGKFLRKSSLDELPQIFNILRGEMSFVGPRPTSFSPETYALWHTEWLDVIPGLTGLWQIEGRGEMEFDQRVRLDVAYIERRGLMLDFVILLRTVFAVLQKKCAL